MAILEGLDQPGFDQLLSGVGAVPRRFKAACDAVQPGRCKDELARLWTDAKVLRQERHDVAHAVLVLDMPTQAGATRRWFVDHPGRPDRPLPTGEELAEIARRTRALSARSLGVQGLAAGYVRTNGTI